MQNCSGWIRAICCCMCKGQESGDGEKAPPGTAEEQQKERETRDLQLEKMECERVQSFRHLLREMTLLRKSLEFIKVIIGSIASPPSPKPAAEALARTRKDRSGAQSLQGEKRPQVLLLKSSRGEEIARQPRVSEASEMGRLRKKRPNERRDRVGTGVNCTLSHSVHETPVDRLDARAIVGKCLGVKTWEEGVGGRSLRNTRDGSLSSTNRAAPRRRGQAFGAEVWRDRIQQRTVNSFSV
ncbi:hypothetical protein chiPu_0014249 [Chiloscyllium punctatum]|uniref:Uncharacterized protein n=1 Tax=Chiloscyllium punctatum TaxID=137246 RepID=A0A401SZE6_CHIPU|nr:hypothetical protein [Chiloscyllium punctatum]